MSFVASILILLSSFLSVHFCHSLAASQLSMKAKSNLVNEIRASNDLPPETGNKNLLKNTDDVTESILSEIEQLKYSVGSKEAKDGSIEENDQTEMKFKSINRCRKLIVVISETKAKSNKVSSHGGHKRKRSRGIDIDYDPPKTHPPSHN